MKIDDKKCHHGNSVDVDDGAAYCRECDDPLGVPALQDDPEILVKLDSWFTHHAPTGDQVQRYERIRRTAHVLAMVIVQSCPGGADRTAALRKLRESVMTANAAIACGES